MAENPYGLRIATEHDAAALFDFALPHVRECAVQPVSEERVRRLVERCVFRDRAIAAVITGPGGIQGSLGATVETHDCADDPHIMVRWLGTAKEFRNTDTTARLLKFCQWMHETLGGDTRIPVLVPLLTTSDQQRKMALYQRRAPQVCVLHGFGCLPDRELITLKVPGEGQRQGSKEAPGAAGIKHV